MCIVNIDLCATVCNLCDVSSAYEYFTKRFRLEIHWIDSILWIFSIWKEDIGIKCSIHNVCYKHITESMQTNLLKLKKKLIDRDASCQHRPTHSHYKYQKQRKKKPIVYETKLRWIIALKLIELNIANFHLSLH